jgi:hypothetical protein
MTIVAPEDGDFLDPVWAEQVVAAVTALETFQSTISGASTYTPTWGGTGSNPSLVNGTISGRYMRQGNWGVLHVAMTMGASTTYGTGQWTWTLPPGWTALAAGFSGWAQILDNGTKRYPCTCYLETTTQIRLVQPVAAGDGGVSSTQPHTWASTDALSFGMFIPLA